MNTFIGLPLPLFDCLQLNDFWDKLLQNSIEMNWFDRFLFFFRVLFIYYYYYCTHLVLCSIIQGSCIKLQLAPKTTRIVYLISKEYIILSDDRFIIILMESIRFRTFLRISITCNPIHIFPLFSISCIDFILNTLCNFSFSHKTMPIYTSILTLSCLEFMLERLIKSSLYNLPIFSTIRIFMIGGRELVQFNFLIFLFFLQTFSLF